MDECNYSEGETDTLIECSNCGEWVLKEDCDIIDDEYCCDECADSIENEEVEVDDSEDEENVDEDTEDDFEDFEEESTSICTK